MSLQWVRLWLDMPNDPKWRVVARRSGQRIGDVVAVYAHMLCQARVADTPGRIEAWDDEDVAAALDLNAEDVQAIREAMQGKVLDGDRLTGWEKRQPRREDDGANDRKRKQRDQARQERDGAARHDVSRNVTQRPAPDTDADTDAESEQQQPSPGDSGTGSAPPRHADPPAGAAAAEADAGGGPDAAQPADKPANGAAQAEPDQQQIQDACRRVQRAVNAGTPMPNVAPTVRKWLRWGCDLERDIVPAICDVMDRRDQAGEGPPSKITYFDRPVWEAHQERLSKPPASDVGRGNDNELPTSTGPPWRARMNGYRDRGIWLDSWGPEPGKRGCQVPDEILVEFGYSERATEATG